MSLFAAVREGAADGGAVAVSSVAGVHTYADLLATAAHLADDLARLTPPGVPVVAAVRDVAATVTVTLAADLAGIVVIHADPSAPRLPGGLQLRDGAADLGAIVLEPGGGLRLAARHVADPPSLSGVPLGAQIFLTSGSTGTPTAVVRSVAAMLADGDRVATALDYAADTAVVASAPAFHVYGFAYAVVGPLSRGASVHHAGNRSVPSQLARAVRAHGARVMIAHPFQYRLLADAPQDFGPLRRAVSAGGPLSAGVARTVLDRHGFTLLNCYGSSEAGAVTLSPVTGDEPAGDAGPPLPGVELRVAAVEGLDSGTELLIASDSLASGRLDGTGLRPLAPDGYYHTGDLADLVDGRIRLRGRIDAMITVAGEQVSPAEIERAIGAHPAVRDVQVVAVEDPVRGGLMPAARVVADGVDAATLLAWCRQELAPHQLPRRIDFLAELPRSATGKPIRLDAAREQR